MTASNPFVPGVIQPSSPSARCTCDHSVYCDCACHGRHCDASENACDIAFLPDEGGLTHWGCPACSPGQDLPHNLGCDVIGWNVPLEAGRTPATQGRPRGTEDSP